MVVAPSGNERRLEVVYDRDHTPVDNMALDEDALQSGEGARLRLYGWLPAGLSIGYFQRLEDFLDLPGPHAIVRRTTGGGAIHHEAEITFALTCDEAALPVSIDDRYRLVHRAVARALADVGVAVRSCGGGAPAPRPHETWCYARATCHDLVAVANGLKLVGSAQRRSAGRVLHHGSIPVHAPTLGPACASLADTVADVESVRRDLGPRIAHHLADELGLGITEARAGEAPLRPPEPLRRAVEARLAKC